MPGEVFFLPVSGEGDGITFWREEERTIFFFPQGT